MAQRHYWMRPALLLSMARLELASVAQLSV
jgi:hypothetical protein